MNYSPEQTFHSLHVEVNHQHWLYACSDSTLQMAVVTVSVCLPTANKLLEVYFKVALNGAAHAVKVIMVKMQRMALYLPLQIHLVPHIFSHVMIQCYKYVSALKSPTLLDESDVSFLNQGLMSMRVA